MINQNYPYHNLRVFNDDDTFYHQKRFPLIIRNQRVISCDNVEMAIRGKMIFKRAYSL